MLSSYLNLSISVQNHSYDTNISSNKLDVNMSTSITHTSTPWRNGYYQARDFKTCLYLVDGENTKMQGACGPPSNPDIPVYNGTWKFGDFGEAHPDVAKESGKSHYNVQMTLWGGVFSPKAVVSDDGTKLFHYGIAHGPDVFEWMSEEEVEEYKKSGDPIESIPHPYKEQPDSQGKLLWITGPPGTGKSTNAFMLNQKANYVYYEADCFLNNLNPFVPIDVQHENPMFAQNFIMGVPQEKIDISCEGGSNFLAMAAGQKHDFEKVCAFYVAISDDVAKDKKRIGGDWAISQAVPTRALRDRIRETLGSDLIFVVLHMTKEDQHDRLKARHGDDEALSEMLSLFYDFYEPAGEDEPNAIHLLVTKDMTKDDVADKILQLVEKYP